MKSKRFYALARDRKLHLSAATCRFIALSQPFLLTFGSSANQNLPPLFTSPPPSGVRPLPERVSVHPPLAVPRVVLIRAEGLTHVANVRATECLKVTRRLQPADAIPAEERGDGVYSKTLSGCLKSGQEPRTRTQVTRSPLRHTVSLLSCFMLI